ncbi:MAG TPA: tetratricopeptide repeat protein [Candidatus Flavonifractor intestinipullorum]|uniref:Tetratricopeptide repeat protein n=1 Tax=Candidatus Flavonifractor intestinipullorum TaxID=2838587 RepID=A0A9D2MAC0_9FIRM|nr:tetratricopeptide repeat protein [Candidatus Flavonifractor intestinipullorum]
MKQSVKKLPIVLPLALLAVLLLGAAVTTRLSRDTAAAHTDLGQKYLNSMDYSGAVAEFMQSLSLDPTNEEARLGLAEAYLAMEETDLVPQVLQPLTENGNPEAYRVLAESQSQAQDTGGALVTAQTLVETTDEEEDYALRDELLQQVLAEPRSYAAGVDQRLAVVDGAVYSAGSNALGQLGTGANLATNTVQEELLPAGFPGGSGRVYCAGRTSYVVDTAGNLWASGENRWGQMGLSYVPTNPQSGWTQLTDSGDVAAVAGTVGSLYVLKTDGSLWYAGQGSVLELRRVPVFSAVSSIASDSSRTAALTAGGELYINEGGPDAGWTRTAREVKTFSLSENGGLVWVTLDNQVCSERGFSVPEDWTQGEEGSYPGFTVRDLAADGRGLLLLDGEGGLWRLYDGRLYQQDETARAVYAAGDYAVAELEGGTFQLWDLSRVQPETVTVTLA